MKTNLVAFICLCFLSSAASALPTLLAKGKSYTLWEEGGKLELRAYGPKPEVVPRVAAGYFLNFDPGDANPVRPAFNGIGKLLFRSSRVDLWQDPTGHLEFRSAAAPVLTDTVVNGIYKLEFPRRSAKATTCIERLSGQR